MNEIKRKNDDSASKSLLSIKKKWYIIYVSLRPWILGV